MKILCGFGVARKPVKPSAFSLIELSIVILVIGILIAGVIQGSKLYYKSQLLVAQNLTRNSPVNSIKDLLLWYETTLESSFKANEAINSSSVSVWYDNNLQALIKNNATSGNSPRFIENAFANGIPGIRFNGLNSFMQIGDTTPLVGSLYTIFLVEQKRAVVSTQTFILNLGGGSGNGCCILIGWNADTRIIVDKWGGGPSYTSSSFAYSQPTARMHTFQQLSTGAKYWLSGGLNPEGTSGSTSTRTAGGTGYISNSCCGKYNGDIAEIIVYTRSLANEERQAIESYLSKKYNIPITG